MRATRWLVGGAAAIALVGLGTGALADTSVAVAPPPSLNEPLATSFVGGSSVWAMLPMGRLSDPKNTFWQLFVRRRGTARWALATPEGVADNGGLIGSPTSGNDETVGFETSQLLQFSPLAFSVDAGERWTGGALPRPLSDVPDALATSGTRLYALVNNPPSMVLSASSAASPWTNFVDERSLAKSQAGRECGLAKITALAGTVTGPPLIGANCDRQGTIGVFVQRGDRWQLLGDRGASKSGGTAVLAVTTTALGASALVATTAHGSSDLALISITRGSTRWIESKTLNLNRSLTLSSAAFSPTGGVGLVVEGAGHDEIDVLNSTSTGWTRLPPTGEGPGVVVFEVGGAPELLTASGSTFRVLSLSSSAVWTRVQRLVVPIEFGSSN